MPKIHPYEPNTVPDLTTSSKVATAGDTGEGLQQLGSGIAKLGAGIEEHTTRQEAGQNDLSISVLETDKVKELKNLQQPLNDEQIGQFMSDYDDKVSKLSENTSTGASQEYLDKKNAATRESIFKALLTRNATLTGEQTTANYHAMTQTKSYMANSVPDMQTFQKVSQDMRDYANIQNVPKATADELYQKSMKEVSFSNFEGNLRLKGADYAKGLIDAGAYKDFIDGTDRDRMVKMADSYEKAKSADYKKAINDQNLAERQMQKKVGLEFVDLAASKQLSTDRILTTPGVSWEFKKRWMDTVSRGENINFKLPDQQAIQKAQVYDKLHGLPDDHPGAITEPEQLMNDAAGLNDSDVGELNQSLKEKNDPSKQTEVRLKNTAIQKAKSVLIDPKLNGMDAVGSKRYNEFIGDLNKTYDQEVKAGKSSIDLMTPGTKDYIVDKLIRAHAKTPQELVRQKNQTQPVQMGPAEYPIKYSGGKPYKFNPKSNTYEPQ